MWAFATRSRLDNCKRFIQAWNDTQASTPVYVRLDLDDPDLDFLKMLPWPATFQIHTGPRIGLSRSINEVFEQCPNEPWYGFLADDLLPQTLCWDQLIIEAASSNNIAYPNDLGKDSFKDLPTHPCVGGDLVRAIGWLGFPPCQHFYTDTVWRYIGNQLNNIYRLDDVVVEHLHYSVDKSEMDLVYEESSAKYRSDKTQYGNWVDATGPELIARLIAKGFKNDSNFYRV